MTYHLLLVRPRFEGVAAKTAYALARAHGAGIEIGDTHPSYTPPYNPFHVESYPLFPEPVLDPSTHPAYISSTSGPSRSQEAPFNPDKPFDPSTHPTYIASTLWRSQLIAYSQAIDPRDSWNNSIVDICYPTKPDPRHPQNQIALITGYIFIRFADPDNPLPSDILKQSSASIRYLTVFSHEEPDPTSPSARISIYKPYTFPDEFVRSLDTKLRQNQYSIIQQLIGKKVKIPCGLCMGMQGKIKKITYYPTAPDEAVVLVKVLHDGIFAKTYLSFTLAELG